MLETNQTNGKRGMIRLGVALSITALVLYVLARHFIGFKPLLHTLQHAKWSWFAIPFGLLFVNLILAGIRWRLILTAAGYSVPFTLILDAMLTTWPLALITPSRAGDLVRAYVIREYVPIPQGAGSVLVEKCIDVQSLCILTCVGGLWMGLHHISLLGAAFLVALWGGLWIWMRYMDRLLQWRFLARFQDKIEKLFSVFRLLVQSPKYLLGTSLLSLMAWLNAIGIITALLYSFGVQIHWSYPFALWPLALFVGQLPLTFAGLGTRDAAFYTLLWFVGVPHIISMKAPVFASTTSYAILTTGLFALLGLPWMLRFLHRERTSKSTLESS